MVQRAAIDSLLVKVTALKAGDWSWRTWRTSKRTSVLKTALSALSALLALSLIIMWYPGSGDDHLVSDGGRGAMEVPNGEAARSGEADAAGSAWSERASYKIIAKENLFNPKRKEKWAVKKAPARRSRRTPSPITRNTRDTLLLEGVVVFDGNYTAFVKDTTKRKDNVKQVTVGDVVGEFTVISIKDEELTLKGTDGTTRVLSLYSKEKPVKRKGAAPTRPTTVQPRSRGPRPIPTQPRNSIRK